MSVFDWLKKEFVKAKSFVQRYPTPYSFIRQQIYPQAKQQIQRQIQRQIIQQPQRTINYVRPKIIEPVKRYLEPAPQMRFRDIVRELPKAVSRVIGPRLFTETILPKVTIPAWRRRIEQIETLRRTQPKPDISKPLVWNPIKGYRQYEEAIKKLPEEQQLARKESMEELSGVYWPGEAAPLGKRAGKIVGKAIEKGIRGKGLEKVGQRLIKAGEEKLTPFLKGLEQDKKELAKAIQTGTEKEYALKNLAQTGEERLRQVNEAMGKSEINQKEFMDIAKNWYGKTKSAEIKAVQKAFSLRKTPIKGEELIRAIENPALAKTPTVKNYLQEFRKIDDEIFNLAKKTGMDINYLKNHIAHIWKEPLGEVVARYQTLGKKYGFAMERAIPSYEEGLKLGLKLKYTNPAQILAEQYRKLENVKANLEFLEKLKNKGLIVAASPEAQGAGFKFINAPGFPKSISQTSEGGAYIGQYMAPAGVADTINRLFYETPRVGIEKLTGIVGGISSKIQDIALSGGIPKTPINWFTLAQTLWKEIPAGKPLAARRIFTGLTDNMAQNYFRQNANQISKLLERDIPIPTSFNIRDFAPATTIEKIFGNSLGMAWDKFVSDPTFKRTMPMYMIDHFNSIENKLLQAGKTPQEAADIAAEAVRNAYGTGSALGARLETRWWSDLKRTLILAPKYRSALLRFFIDTVKGLKAPLAIKNRYNMLWLGGAIASYIGADKANYYFTGKHMWQNPPGKENTLLIPMSGGTTIGIPWMPSIMTIPRAAYSTGKALVLGNIKEATKQVSGLLSMAVKPTFDIWKNENYFGQPVYDENAPAPEKWKQIANYLFNPTTGAYTHPYIRESIRYLQGKQPVGQALTKALELPIRYYKTKTLTTSEYYDTKKQVDEIIDKISKGQTSEAEGRKKIAELRNNLIVYEKRLGTFKPEYEQSNNYKINEAIALGKLSDKEKEIYARWKKDPKESAWESIASSADLLANPKILQAKTSIAIMTALQNGKPVDPLYSLPTEQQQIALLYQATPIGSQERSGILKQNDWLPDYWDIRDAYFSKIGAKSVSDYPQPSPEVAKKQEYYFSLPYGTGQRTAFINVNPDLKQYWDYKDAWRNQKRADMGLPPIEKTSYSYSKWGSYKKKGKKKKKAKKIKTIRRTFTIPKPKTVSLKVANAKEIKYIAPKATAKKNKIKRLRTKKMV